MSTDRQEVPYHDSAVIYLDSLKDYLGRVRDFDYILELRKGVSFGEFLEGIQDIGTDTDYAGFHVTDPNWFEEGKYEGGALSPEFYDRLQRHLRNRYILEEDQTLDATCYYSKDPNHGSTRWGERAQFLVTVSGGERNNWGQFVLIYLEEDFEPFEFGEDRSPIEELKGMSSKVGRPEISFEEFWAKYMQTRHD